MLIDFVPYESWEKSNEFIRLFLGLPETSTVRVYNSLASAVYDSSYCLAQFMSHKRKISYRNGTTWAFDWVLPHLYKDAYQLTQFKCGQEIEHLSTLDRETSLVMLSEDHPITGEVFPWDELDQKLNEKKIYSVRVSHFQHRYDEAVIRPYSVRVCKISPHLTIVVAGERFRSAPAFAAGEVWSSDYVEREYRRWSHGIEQRDEVLRIEADLPPGFEAMVKSESRVFDRIAISNSLIGGDALRAELLLLLGIPRNDIRAQWIQTANLCAWGGSQERFSWWDPRPKDDLIRGLVVLSPELVKNRDFHQDLLTLAPKCRMDLSWELVKSQKP